MSRGKKSRGGSDSNRGGDNGAGRGPSRGRGRGGRGRGRGRGRGQATVGGGPPTQNQQQSGIRWMEHDVDQLWQALDAPSPVNPPARGWGRGRGGGFARGYTRGRGADVPHFQQHFIPPFQPRGTGFTPRGRGGGRGDFRGRGRGRGGIGAAQTFRREDRMDPRRAFGAGGNPLLKPVLFVKSTLVLFKEEEEIFMPEIVDTDNLDPEDLPETHRLEEIFHHTDHQDASDAQLASSSDSEDEADDDERAEPQELVIADEDVTIVEEPFATNVSVAALVDATVELDLNPPGLSTQDEASMEAEGERVAYSLDSPGGHMGSAPTDQATLFETYTPEPPIASQDDLIDLFSSDSRPTEPSDLFFVDGQGDMVPESIPQATDYRTILGESHLSILTAGLADDDIVLVPRTAARASFSAVPSLPELPVEVQPEEVPTVDTIEFSFAPRSVFTPRERQPDPRRIRRKQLKKERRSARRMVDWRNHAGLGFHGAPRQGDSDLDWGSDGPPTNELENQHTTDANEDLSATMDIDPDLLDVDLVKGMQRVVAALGSNQVTMMDVELEERIEEEDREEREGADRGSSHSSGDEMAQDTIYHTLELEIDEDSDGEDEDEDEDEGEEDEDEDEDEEPETRFKRRLAGIREKGKGPARDEPEGLDDDEDGPQFSGKFSWDADPETLGAEIEDYLERNADILEGRNRRERRAIMRAIKYAGRREAELPAPSIKGKGKEPPSHISKELQEAWERDRQKKAQLKREREDARAAAKEQSNGGKKKKNGRKVKPSDISSGGGYDMFQVERDIRVFLTDLGRQTFELPPMDKESRRRVHLLADCFDLKCDSKGSGANRYPTLRKTTWSGINVDEAQVKKLLAAIEKADPNSATSIAWGAFYGKGRFKGKKGEYRGGGHREGEIVGQHAAKIGGENIGYRLLQSMGWQDGERIGVTTGGLVDPLTAVMKRTKLGLGAY